ncbi:TRM11 family SAM-dependent methyltransferase [Paenibacillus montanisoli]|nr:RNA methyltransferase [Paenibacillus montanisoli]
MEMRSLFGENPINGCVITDKNIDPSRSPFIRGKLTIRLEANDPAGIAEQAADAVRLEGRTFKVTFVGGRVSSGEDASDSNGVKGGFDFDRQRAIEREIGWRIVGKAEMRRPDIWLGAAFAGGRFLFGEYEQSEAVWLKHNDKPQPYSTALSTRVARAVVNIAAPTTDLRIIDPCCGIGTVLIEALSMGISIVGFDINPLALKGARINLARFGMPDVVKLRDMTKLDPAMFAGPPGGVVAPQNQSAAAAGDPRPFDAAIIDLPYNLCSKLPSAERLAMLRSAGRLAERVILVTTELIDDDIAEAGFAIADRCVVRKGRFERQIIACYQIQRSM